MNHDEEQSRPLGSNQHLALESDQATEELAAFSPPSMLDEPLSIVPPESRRTASGLAREIARTTLEERRLVDGVFHALDRSNTARACHPKGIVVDRRLPLSLALPIDARH